MSTNEPHQPNAADADASDNGSIHSNTSQPTAAASPATPAHKSRAPLAQDRFGSASSDKFLESTTIVAGFLVIATFPVVMQNLEDSAVHRLHYFSATAVQNFAAVAIGLFLVAIALAQWTKLIWQDYERRYESAYGKRRTRDERALSVVALQCLLLTAIFFFLLVVAGFVGPVGLAFAVLDGVGLVGFLITFVAVLGNFWAREVKRIREKQQRDGDV